MEYLSGKFHIMQLTIILKEIIVDRNAIYLDIFYRYSSITISLNKGNYSGLT
jgi:hypothetical protein